MLHNSRRNTRMRLAARFARDLNTALQKKCYLIDPFDTDRSRRVFPQVKANRKSDSKQAFAWTDRMSETAKEGLALILFSKKSPQGNL